jgi:uncharacterized membrane protein YhaH (DUF805 family)
MQSPFSGRYKRVKYFWTSLLIAVPIAVIFVLFGESEGTGLRTLLSVISFTALSPMGVKRLHDLNKSGWNYLLFLIPLVGLLLGLILLFKRGTKGSNQYGPDSLAKAT